MKRPLLNCEVTVAIIATVASFHRELRRVPGADPVETARRLYGVSLSDQRDVVRFLFEDIRSPILRRLEHLFGGRFIFDRLDASPTIARVLEQPGGLAHMVGSTFCFVPKAKTITHYKINPAELFERGRVVEAIANQGGR